MRQEDAAKDVPLSLLIKLLTAAQGTEITISCVPGGERQCRAVARRETHPSAIAYVEGETSFMVCSVPFAQISWQKIPLLFIYKKLAQHVCNSVWNPSTDLLAKLYLPSVRRNAFVLCVLTPQACFVTLLMKVKTLFHRDTQENKF